MKVCFKSAISSTEDTPVVGVYRDTVHIASVTVVTDEEGEQSIEFVKYVQGLSHCAQAGIIQHASDFIDADYSGDALVYEAEV